MKKMISLVLVVVMVLGMTACGAKTETPTTAAPAATEGTVAEAAPILHYAFFIMH